jgi:histidinol-phosphate aminotransferase
MSAVSTQLTNGESNETEKGAFNLQTCARPNILTLKPYRCAREYSVIDPSNSSDYTSGVLLDANENAHGPSLPASITTSSTTNTSEETYITGLNRYPDPHQIALKKLICDLRNSQAQPLGQLTPDNLFCGVGSDEAIDAVMRVFCKPARDKIMICTPTYGMYKVSAAINEVDIIDVPLEPFTWEIDIDKVSS